MNRERRVVLYGPNRLYIYGTLSSDGIFDLHVSTGGKMRGEVDQSGDVELKGPDGRYRGKIDNSGSLALNGPSGYLHGKAD